MPKIKRTAVVPRGPVQMVPRAVAQAAINRAAAGALAAPRRRRRVVRRLGGNVRKARGYSYTRRGYKYTRLALNKTARRHRGWLIKGKYNKGTYMRCVNPRLVMIPTFCRTKGPGRPRRRAG